MRIAAGNLRVEPDLAQHLGDGAAALLRRADIMRHQSLGDDVTHGHAGDRAPNGSWKTIWTSRRNAFSPPALFAVTAVPSMATSPS